MKFLFKANPSGRKYLLLTFLAVTINLAALLNTYYPLNKHILTAAAILAISVGILYSCYLLFQERFSKIQTNIEKLTHGIMILLYLLGIFYYLFLVCLLQKN